jgi:hypothetical protein
MDFTTLSIDYDALCLGLAQNGYELILLLKICSIIFGIFVIAAYQACSASPLLTHFAAILHLKECSGALPLSPFTGTPAGDFLDGQTMFLACHLPEPLGTLGLLVR